MPRFRATAGSRVDDVVGQRGDHRGIERGALAQVDVGAGDRQQRRLPAAQPDVDVRRQDLAALVSRESQVEGIPQLAPEPFLCLARPALQRRREIRWRNRSLFREHLIGEKRAQRVDVSPRRRVQHSVAKRRQARILPREVGWIELPWRRLLGDDEHYRDCVENSQHIACTLSSVLRIPRRAEVGLDMKVSSPALRDGLAGPAIDRVGISSAPQIANIDGRPEPM